MQSEKIPDDAGARDVLQPVPEHSLLRVVRTDHYVEITPFPCRSPAMYLVVNNKVEICQNICRYIYKDCAHLFFVSICVFVNIRCRYSSKIK